MREIGKRCEDGETVVLVEMPEVEFDHFVRLNEVCNDANEDRTLAPFPVSWDEAYFDVSRMFEGKFQRAFVAVRLFIEAQMKRNELSHVANDLLGIAKAFGGLPCGDEILEERSETRMQVQTNE